jgi:hypothetical protein
MARGSMELWVGCVAGALSDADYRQKLAAAGFEAIDIEATRVYNVKDAREFLCGAGMDADRNRAGGRREVHQRLRTRAEAFDRPPLL